MTTNDQQPVDGLLTLRLYTREGLSEVLGDLWVPDVRVLKDLLNRSINLSEMSDVLRGSFIVTTSYESADPTSVEVTGIARLASVGEVTAFGIDFRKIAAEIVAPQFRVRLTNKPKIEAPDGPVINLTTWGIIRLSPSRLPSRPCKDRPCVR